MSSIVSFDNERRGNGKPRLHALHSFDVTGNLCSILRKKDLLVFDHYSSRSNVFKK